ncbi:MAG TPA: hypothetical protein VM692_04480, partial [Gammaproteobacteria bacterium]|nr:hypothetical protein [Gammaproteobacteria bacterium]
MASQHESRAASPLLSAEVQQADQCDAAGAHAEAIQHLVAGTQKKDVEATTRLGKRLLVGDRAPCFPKEGAGLVAEASASGGAEAAAVLAVLYAVGASQHHDLRAALESLIAAAERGWAPARAQLEVLAAGVPGAENQPPPDAAAGARVLAQRVDLTAWQTAPPAVDLCASPLVRSYPRFASEAVCRWLVEKARGRLSRALVYEAVRREVMAKPTRTNTA